MDDLGFVPDSQTQDHSDLGFVPEPTPEPNMKPVQKVFNDHIAEYRESQKGKEANPEQHEADNFMDDWLAGWQQTATGLGIRGKAPDIVLPKDASRAAKFISGAASYAGDAPLMALGGLGGAIVGGVAGSEVPVVGNAAGAVVGGGAGAFALPAALRKTLMDHYQKGDIKDFNDFYDRASGTLLETLKGAGTGAATATVGLLTGGALSGAVGPLAKLGAVKASELATMTTVGSAMEGKVPSWDNFMDNALLLGVLHGVSAATIPLAKPVSEAITNHLNNKMMKVYAETGIHPNDLNAMASLDPTLHQQLLSSDPTLPQQLEKARDPKAPDTKITIKGNDALNEMHPALSDATKNEGPGDLKVESLKEPFPQNKSEAPPRTPSEDSILGRIGEEPTTKKPLSLDALRYNLIDKYDPIKLATEALNDGKALSPKDDPYAMVRSLAANGRRAEAAIEAGPAEFKTLNPTGTKGLTEILAPFKEDLDGFRAYAISKRVLELDKMGKEHGFDVNAAKEVSKSGENKYGQAFKEFVDFNNDILKYGRDSGIISADSYNKIVEHNKNYVSFKRVMDEEQTPGVKGRGAGLNVSNPVKELKGSTREIVDPIESTIRNTQSIINLAEKNRAVLALTEMIDKSKNPEMGQKIVTPKKAIEISSGEAAQALQKMGLDPEDAQSFTVFKSKNDLEDNQIASYKDGKRQVYEVPDLLAKSVKQLDPQTIGMLTEYGRIPANMLRTGMIASPAFQAKHFIRQEAMSTIFAKDGYIPIVTTLQGLGNILGKSEPFYEWLRAGGANDSIAHISENVMQKDLFNLDKETGFVSKTWNTIKSPLQSLKMVTQYLDEARTLGKFINAREAGKDIFQASLDARESAIDASRVGASMRAYNMVVPFANMRVQGLDLIYRNFKEDPVNTFLKLGATITLPSAMLWYANKDDPRWREIPNYVKDMSWIFMTKDQVYRIPKPFEPGVVFGSLPERILESYFTDNPDAFKDFQKTMFETAMPQWVPTYAAPMREQWANKSIMTGAPLISDHMKNVLPEYQSNPYTSTTAKVIAGALRQIPTDLTQKPGSFGSPIIIDNYVREWGGDVGQFTLQAVDKALEKSGGASAIGVDYNTNPPAATLSDIPFIKAFAIRYPSANPQSLTNFFDKYEKIQTRLNSISLLRQQGRYEDMAKEQKNSLALNEFTNLPGFKSAISNDLHLIQTIYKDPDPKFDANQKRQQIDAIYTKMLNEAKRANELLDSIGEKVKEEK